MEATATLRYLQASPQKVRLVADMIRGKAVQEAANLLDLTPKAAARPLRKLLRSAIANAENRAEPMDIDRLYVQRIAVDGGPVAKRIRPAPMGRAFRYVRRTSHVTITLAARRPDEREGG